MIDKKEVKSGEFLLFTEGEYSDYHIVALGRANCDFDLTKTRLEFIVKYPDQNSRWIFSQSKFFSYLVNERQMLIEIDYEEIY
jgi:hypothetical protein